MPNIAEILQGNPNDSDYNKKPVIVQGMTGNYGAYHTQRMLDYGTNIIDILEPVAFTASFTVL